ncbi:MAG TPA: DUF1841 family protein [Burkholderiales bacterium]
MYGSDRQELREVFFRAWRKHRNGEPLEGVETLIVDVALRHPEYHALLDDPERHAGRDYLPELGETNPFMHMGLHIALLEQLSIDHPPGVRSYYQTLRAKIPDPHVAEHAMMECLAEAVWQAQRSGRDLDAETYTRCLQELIRRL